MHHVAQDVGDSLPNENDVEYVMHELDVNKDGTIDFFEFKVLIIKVLRNILRSNLITE
jgi:Ca2+-binding EF-hand superfamily protein